MLNTSSAAREYPQSYLTSKCYHLGKCAYYPGPTPQLSEETYITKDVWDYYHSKIFVYPLLKLLFSYLLYLILNLVSAHL